jgi:GDP-D-mannose 3',5'-epimerase
MVSAFSGSRKLAVGSCGKDACERAVRDVSLIYNLAADMGGMGFIENNKALCMLSVLVNTHMLMMAKEAGVSRFFYSSSACVYAADAYPAMPEDGYGWEKLFFRTNVPALSRRLRVGNPRCALSQRLWATGNLC